MRNESDTFDIGGDLTVHRLGYGAMRVTGDGVLGSPPDEAASIDLLQSLPDLGVDFVDTADSYGPGVSERLLCESGLVDAAVVATKAGLLRDYRTGDWLAHCEPAYLRNQAMVSRDRLGVDSIDLYQLHTVDDDVPLEDSVHALAELRDDGLIDHVGLSNVTVEQLDRARDIVEIATVQNRYNVGYRADEDVLRACESYGIGFIPWYPIGAGDLGGVTGIDAVAEAHDASRQQIALAWLLAHSPVTLPIPGTNDPDHLRENVAASAIDLTDEDMTRLAG